MADDFTKTQAALEEIEAEQRARFAPKEEPPAKTPAEEYAAALAASRSKAFSIDVGWLR
jgi:hypothetical protein